MNLPLEILRRRASSHPQPLLFATISGAHLYGFPSTDSDFDLRGAHILPLSEVLSLSPKNETIEISSNPLTDPGGGDHLEFDIVSHDIKKFFTLLLKKNGYVLEQLLSPLIILTSPEHEELKSLTPQLLTKHHAHHYLGFAQNQWNLFQKESPRRVKPLLYVYRVLLTGIHLMKSHTIEANLQILNDIYKLPYIPDLIAQKLAGPEQSTLPDTNFPFHHQQFLRFEQQLKQSQSETSLPDLPTAHPALNNLLLRLRLQPAPYR